MEPFKAIEEHIDKDETEEKEAEEKIDIKMEEIKDQNQSEKIEHDKYIKILEENNKELLDKYEMTSKENADLKNKRRRRK